MGCQVQFKALYKYSFNLIKLWIGNLISALYIQIRKPTWKPNWHKGLKVVKKKSLVLKTVLKTFQQSRSYLSWAVKWAGLWKTESGRHFQWQGWNLGKAGKSNISNVLHALWPPFVFLSSAFLINKSLPLFLQLNISTRAYWLIEMAGKKKEAKDNSKHLTKNKKDGAAVSWKETRGRKSHQNKRREPKSVPYTGVFSV